ncbi:MAG: phytanoyl-CoA dioxygenase family protein [Pseudomonadota bacterium]
MPAQDHRLTTQEMAQFVVNGYLRFDGLIPAQINASIIEELSNLYAIKMRQIADAMGLNPDQLAKAPALDVPRPDSLALLSECYPEPSTIGAMLRLPQVQGIIQSLVGYDPYFDHDFVHYIPGNNPNGQHLHVDAVIDDRNPSFDIQLFYFPTSVAPGAGGTRFIPGTHLRYTRAEGVARYQNILGEEQYSGSPGTLLIFHQGLWHAGQPNPSDQDRWMYKIRLNPREAQVRLWNTDDFDELHNDARDHMFAKMRKNSVANILRTALPWQNGHEVRYEQMERARLWRYLSGDPEFDVDFYHTRIERRAQANQESL